MSYACTGCKTVFTEIPENKVDHSIACSHCGGNQFMPVQVVVEMRQDPGWTEVVNSLLGLLFVGTIVVGVIWFISSSIYWANHTNVVVIEEQTCVPTQLPCIIRVYDSDRGFTRSIEVVDIPAETTFKVGQAKIVENQYLGSSDR